MPRFAVETYTLCDGWVNSWTCEQDGNEIPWTFESREAAQEELNCLFEEQRQAIARGEITLSYSTSDFLITEYRQCPVCNDGVWKSFVVRQQAIIFKDCLHQIFEVKGE